MQELLKHDANIDFTDCINNTALHFATEGKDIEIVRTLLKNGCSTVVKADSHCNENDTFFTAFEVALEENSIDIAKIIAFHEN